MKIKAFVFDAYGTLFDVHSAVRRHAAVLGSRHEDISALWRVKQLEYSWVRTLMGSYVDFWRCTEDALAYALQVHGAAGAGIEQSLLEAYRSLDAYPDVAKTLATLRERGYMTAVLSNGSTDMLRSAVASAGLEGAFDAVLSVDAVRKFKTDPATYGLVTSELGVEPSEVSFQSSNAWDIAGASVFGFECVRVNRAGLPDEYADLTRAASIRSLDELLRFAPAP